MKINCMCHMKTSCLITVFVYKINCSAYTVDGVFVWCEGHYSASSVWNGYGLQSFLSWSPDREEIFCSSSQLDTRHNSDKSLFNLHYSSFEYLPIIDLSWVEARFQVSPKVYRWKPGIFFLHYNLWRFNTWLLVVHALLLYSHIP